MIITIDGPSGSGKSTVARKLAKRLAFLYVNQGAFFRAIGVVGLERNIDLDSDEAVSSLARELTFSLSNEEANKTGLLINSEDRSVTLLSAEAGRLASRVAVHPGLRELLLATQYSLLRGDDWGDDRGTATSEIASAVVEGRDAGSIGFPQAELKLYLDAEAEIRAKRRFDELQNILTSGGSISPRENSTVVPTVRELAEEMRERDERDRAREVAPLSIPEGGIVIDTSSRTIEEVLEHLEMLVEQHSK